MHCGYYQSVSQVRIKTYYRCATGGKGGSVTKTLRALALLAGCAVSLAGTAEAGPGKPSVQWAKSWKEAVEEATARNVPIVISFHQDN